MMGTRREAIRAGLVAGGVAYLGGGLSMADESQARQERNVVEAQAIPERPGDFTIALNTSTISGQKPTIRDAIQIAAGAGYDGIEPWIRELDDHTKGGGSLDDLAKELRDRNLKVVDAIGFFEWAVDDDVKRAKALEEARRNMAMVAKIGGTRIAAPVFGASDAASPKLDLDRVAERYRTLLEIGQGFGVTPLVEVWGFSRNLTTLAEAAHVAVGADHPHAAILGDVYHFYKGGSGFGGLRLLGSGAMPVLHINDYPDRPRAGLSDADRVLPGDGVAPLRSILTTLRATGTPPVLSLELFNKELWKLDPAAVAAQGLAKIRAVITALDPV